METSVGGGRNKQNSPRKIVGTGCGDEKGGTVRVSTAPSNLSPTSDSYTQSTQRDTRKQSSTTDVTRPQRSCSHRRPIRRGRQRTVETIKIRQRLQVGLVLNELLRPTVEEANVGVCTLHNFTIQLQHQPQHTVLRRRIRPRETESVEGNQCRARQWSATASQTEKVSTDCPRPARNQGAPGEQGVPHGRRRKRTAKRTQERTATGTPRSKRSRHAQCKMTSSLLVSSKANRRGTKAPRQSSVTPQAWTALHTTIPPTNARHSHADPHPQRLPHPTPPRTYPPGAGAQS